MFWREIPGRLQSGSRRPVRKPRIWSLAIIPLFAGVMIETIIEILIIRYNLGRSWEDIAFWVGLIGLLAAMILFFFDADRLVVKIFRSEIDYQNFLGNLMIAVSALLFIAVTVRWYLKHGDKFSL